MCPDGERPGHQGAAGPPPAPGLYQFPPHSGCKQKARYLGSGDTTTQDVPSSTYFLPVCLICPRESSSGILQGACGCNDSKTSNNKVINLGLPQGRGHPAQAHRMAAEVRVLRAREPLGAILRSPRVSWPRFAQVREHTRMSHPLVWWSAGVRQTVDHGCMRDTPFSSPSDKEALQPDQAGGSGPSAVTPIRDERWHTRHL